MPGWEGKGGKRKKKFLVDAILSKGGDQNHRVAPWRESLGKLPVGSDISGVLLDHLPDANGYNRNMTSPLKWGQTTSYLEGGIKSRDVESKRNLREIIRIRTNLSEGSRETRGLVAMLTWVHWKQRQGLISSRQVGAPHFHLQTPNQFSISGGE